MNQLAKYSLRSLFVALFLFSGVLVANAQQPESDREVADCTKPLQAMKRPRARPISSAGVINGKATNFVKPDYPAAARSVNVGGTVKVQVLIDERGCVEEAKVLSGHPLLAAATLNAARLSTFVPTFISWKPVPVYGIIVYQYLPNSMNWLDLGHSSDSIDRLLEYLPADFDRERKLLDQSKSLPWDQKPDVLATVVNSVIAELSDEPRSLWLFMAGRHLKSLSQQSWNPVVRGAILKELQNLLDTVPEDVSSQLNAQLRELIVEADIEVFGRRLKHIEINLSHLGR